MMYKVRNPPEVWKKLGSFMHQDYTILYPNFWNGVDEFWQSITEREKRELVEFLEHITDGELPGGMHKKYWSLSGAEVLPLQLKPFLSELKMKFKSLQNG